MILCRYLILLAPHLREFTPTIKPIQRLPVIHVHGERQLTAHDTRARYPGFAR
jgi:hypothetical protein